MLECCGDGWRSLLLVGPAFDSSWLGLFYCGLFVC